MAETYRTIHSQELVGWNLLIYVKPVTLLLETDKQFSTQVSSVDDYSLTTSQQHDNRGEINNSPSRDQIISSTSQLFILLGLQILRHSLKSLPFVFCSWVFFPLLFLTLLPDQRWKFTQRESLFPSPLSSLCLHTSLISFAKFPPKVCCSSLTRCRQW